MDLEYRLPVFGVLWKLLILAAFPLLVWGYSNVMSVSFSELDEGVNQHKVTIFALYFVLIMIWWWLNPKVQRLLRRGQR
ncbi:hypothetical protein [Motilimonas eburnea]|uniref:hypothetical protein n=1 Tax=Motilimonas eburnea TaxID=1737488 RepID=UPI001E3E913F|nr:hypothetical protein [Motilimonas eburnea]MCE2572232.1 hypothetical protein [Motilimonas eburnea]